MSTEKQSDDLCFILEVSDPDFQANKVAIYQAAKSAEQNLKTELTNPCAQNVQNALELILKYIYREYVRRFRDNERINLAVLINDTRLKELIIKKTKGGAELFKMLNTAGNYVKHTLGEVVTYDNARAGYYAMIPVLKQLCEFISDPGIEKTPALIEMPTYEKEAFDGEANITKSYNKDLGRIVLQAGRTGGTRYKDKLKTHYYWCVGEEKPPKNDDYKEGRSYFVLKREHLGKIIYLYISAQGKAGRLEARYPSERSISEDDFLQNLKGKISLSHDIQDETIVINATVYNPNTDILHYAIFSEDGHLICESDQNKLKLPIEYIDKTIVCTISAEERAGKKKSDSYRLTAKSDKKPLVGGQAEIITRADETDEDSQLLQPEPIPTPTIEPNPDLKPTKINESGPDKADPGCDSDPAVVAVIGLIQNLPTISLTDKCAKSIDKARTFFDALSNSQKLLVWNQKQLFDAENEYEKLAKVKQQQEISDRNKKSIGIVCAVSVLLFFLVSAIDKYVSFDDTPVLNLTGYQAVKSFTVGWFDSGGGRPGYTIDEVNSGILGETVTLNSITDGKIGHEFNFVGAADGTTLREKNVWNANSIEAEDGYAYKVRLYFENSALTIPAEGVAARFNICDTVWAAETNGADSDENAESSGRYMAAVHGYLMGTNTTPEIIGDSVIFVSEHPFHLEYMRGSASLENLGIGTGRGYSLSDDIVNSWIAIGYDELDGVIPAGYEYDGQCVITVVPVFDNNPVSKYDTLLVRKAGTRSWGKTAEVKEGDVIELQFHFKSYESIMWNNIYVYSVLPSEISYVSGSTMVFDAHNPAGLNVKTDGVIASDGLHISDERPVNEAYIRFKAVVGDMTEDKNIYVQSRMPGEYLEDAVVLIPKS